MIENEIRFEDYKGRYKVVNYELFNPPNPQFTFLDTFDIYDVSNEKYIFDKHFPNGDLYPVETLKLLNQPVDSLTLYSAYTQFNVFDYKSDDEYEDLGGGTHTETYDVDTIKTRLASLKTFLESLNWHTARETEKKDTYQKVVNLKEVFDNGITDGVSAESAWQLFKEYFGTQQNAVCWADETLKDELNGYIWLIYVDQPFADQIRTYFNKIGASGGSSEVISYIRDYKPNDGFVYTYKRTEPTEQPVPTTYLRTIELKNIDNSEITDPVMLAFMSAAGITGQYTKFKNTDRNSTENGIVINDEYYVLRRHHQYFYFTSPIGITTAEELDGDYKIEYYDKINLQQKFLGALTPELETRPLKKAPTGKEYYVIEWEDGGTPWTMYPDYPNRLTCPDVILFNWEGVNGFKVDGLIDNDNLFDGMNYVIDANGNGNLKLGGVPSGEVKFKTDINIKDRLNTSFSWYQKREEETQSTLKGIFTITDIQKYRNLYQITAYDNLIKFDKVIDSWLTNLTFPMALKDFYASLCEECGVRYTPYSGINAEYQVRETFATTNITGRQILKYIAEATGGFAMATADGQIMIKHYSDTNVELNNSVYKKYEYKDFTTLPIDQVRNINADVYAGEGENIYQLEDNPLLYADTTAEVQDVFDNILNEVSTITYTPAKLELFDDKPHNIGDVITIDGNKFIVMKKSLSPSGCVLECFGNEKRDDLIPTVKSEIQQLKGASNTFTKTLEETTSKLTKMVGKDEIISVINQTAEQITIEASKINFNGAVSANEKFKINTDGTMEASGANISGSFNMTGGSINIDASSTSLQAIALNSDDWTTSVASGGFATKHGGLRASLTPSGLNIFQDMAYPLIFINATPANGASIAMFDKNYTPSQYPQQRVSLDEDGLAFFNASGTMTAWYRNNNTPVLLITHNTSSWASAAHGEYYSYLLCACAGQGNRVVASTLIPRAFISTSTDSSNPCMAYLEGGYRVYCYFSGGNIYARTEGINADCYVKVYGMY